MDYADHVLALLADCQDDCDDLAISSLEDRILARLRRGPVVSVFQLAVNELGVTYCWALTVIRRLEKRGEIVIVQGESRGSPLIVIGGAANVVPETTD